MSLTLPAQRSWRNTTAISVLTAVRQHFNMYVHHNLSVALINSSADDITTNIDGVDSYAAVKAAGKYKQVLLPRSMGALLHCEYVSLVFREYKRTQGVSTTDLVGRLVSICISLSPLTIPGVYFSQNAAHDQTTPQYQRELSCRRHQWSCEVWACFHTGRMRKVQNPLN